LSPIRTQFGGSALQFLSHHECSTVSETELQAFFKLELDLRFNDVSRDVTALPVLSSVEIRSRSSAVIASDRSSSGLLKAGRQKQASGQSYPSALQLVLHVAVLRSTAVLTQESPEFVMRVGASPGCACGALAMLEARTIPSMLQPLLF